MDEAFKQELDEAFDYEITLKGKFFRTKKGIIQEFGLEKDINLKEVLSPYFSDEKCKYTAEYEYNGNGVTVTFKHIVKEDSEEIKIWTSDDIWVGIDEFLKWLSETVLRKKHLESGVLSFKPAIIKYSKRGKIFQNELVCYLRKKYGKLYTFYM